MKQQPARRSAPPEARLGCSRRSVSALLPFWLLLGLLLGLMSRAAVPPCRAAEDPSSPLRIRMGEVRIEGAIERPDVFYVIPRAVPRLDLGTRGRDYREEILAPLLPAPFERWVQEQSSQEPGGVSRP